MNTKKHKNKKLNKQPNVSNSQNNEPKVEVVTDSQKPDIESEIQECVPETTIIDVKQSDQKEETEFTAPQKPKRTRGKKKKQDEDGCENQPLAPLQTEDVKTDVGVNVEKNLLPVVRKKKNKKKSGVSSETQIMPLPEAKLEKIELGPEVKNESDNVELNIATNEIEKIETIEEAKIAKKKNKKKKHHTDSEKSDKSSEVISCTSAFQKLLDADEEGISNSEIKEIKSEIKDTDYFNPTEIVNIETKIDESSPKIEGDTCAVVYQTPIEGTSEMDLEKSLPIKGKKKNKKENKHPHNIENLDAIQQTTSEEQLIQETSELHLEHEKTKHDTIENVVDSSITDSLKPKAVIVKPVQKKRKENKESKLESLTTQCEPDSKNIIAGETHEDVIVAQELEGVIKVNDFEVKNMQETINKDNSGNVTAQDILDNVNTKKTKRSSKTPEVVTTATDVTKPETTFLENPRLSKTEVKQDDGKDELIFETLVPSDFESGVAEDKLNEILSTITETVDNNKNKEKNKEETSDLKFKIEKSRKKSKKTPKILINPEIPSATNNTIKESNNSKASETENIDKSCLMTPTDDVEIRSVKDDSEDVICDVIPEILHPRSSSEQLTDDNNNTVIQEVFEDTLSIPIQPQNVPIIQGSGGTPTETPETLPCRTKSVEKENIPKIEEKTDIKSKIIEVNKDMEELRLSIERSLAEFNVLEKSEDVPEKQVLGTNTSMTDNPNITVKNDMIIKCNVSKEMAKADENSNVETSPLEDLKSHTEEKEAVQLLINAEDQCKSQEENELKPDYEIIKEETPKTSISIDTLPPICPARREHKKGKKRKGRQDESPSTYTSQGSSTETSNKDNVKEKDSEQKTDATEDKTNQQSKTNESDTVTCNEDNSSKQANIEADYEPIENFEDALTSSADDINDINKTFEMIVNQITEDSQQELASNKPKINIIAPSEDVKMKDIKENPVTPPKNLLGHPNIPVRSNKTDYKKVKDKIPNEKQAKVKIKDDVAIENSKESKESQTEKKSKRQKKLKDSESFCQISNCDDFIYKYSFRRVFLQSACHVCKKELVQFRVPCKFCNLLFYCSLKHKDEDWPHHQALCFAISTIVHIKDLKHIYADAKDITGHNYRLLRMQTILSCEKVLKRRLVPWEQELLLYPRICADTSCREWRQSRLKDCDGCGQISYCSSHPDHLPKNHQRWCKSYALYQKLVTYQQTKGRLEPKLPTKVLKDYEMPEKVNEVLASMFEEKIDLNDVQYAALTQIATAPLTVAFCYQIYKNTLKSPKEIKKFQTSFTIHVVGAELQFEADVLNKWEIFFLHLRPYVKELRVVLISPNLNPGKLPLELLGRIKLCDNCRQNKRRILFCFQDKKTYQEFKNSDDFIYPDIVCAFNPALHRSSVYNGKDPWTSTISTVMKLRVPFIITGHTITELHRDLVRLKECSEIQVLIDPKSTEPREDAKSNGPIEVPRTNGPIEDTRSNAPQIKDLRSNVPIEDERSNELTEDPRTNAPKIIEDPRTSPLQLKVLVEPRSNPFSSVRPDRNFISDDDTPLIFKNHCFMIVCGF